MSGLMLRLPSTFGPQEEKLLIVSPVVISWLYSEPKVKYVGLSLLAIIALANLRPFEPSMSNVGILSYPLPRFTPMKPERSV
ncbi:hypothetical protein D3C73_685060 [compost metagenome]